MKIAITSTGASMDSAVDERFGRARYLVFADSETGLVELLDNSTNMNAAEGAGIQLAQRVAARRPDWLLTGHVGPKAFRALTAAGVRIATGVTGTCREALERFKNGQLSQAEGPDVPGHWSS